MLMQTLPFYIKNFNTSLAIPLAIAQQVSKTYWDTWHAVWRYRA